MFSNQGWVSFNIISDLFIQEGIPEYIRSDNGSEFKALILKEWLQSLKVKTTYLAEAAYNIFSLLGYVKEKIPSKAALIAQINDRSGQPELYNYFALRNEEDLSAPVRTKTKTYDYL